MTASSPPSPARCLDSPPSAHWAAKAVFYLTPETGRSCDCFSMMGQSRAPKAACEHCLAQFHGSPSTGPPRADTLNPGP